MKGLYLNDNFKVIIAFEGWLICELPIYPNVLLLAENK